METGRALASRKERSLKQRRKGQDPEEKEVTFGFIRERCLS
uniref:Uncharacterized protein n=1 Tax=Anguilla anguilla TaxID=7936 RepID=A0A0E9VGS5_ANGAN